MTPAASEAPRAIPAAARGAPPHGRRADHAPAAAEALRALGRSRAVALVLLARSSGRGSTSTAATRARTMRIVEADVVAVASRVGGTVAEVLVPEDPPVKAGQPHPADRRRGLRVRVRAGGGRSSRPPAPRPPPPTRRWARRARPSRAARRRRRRRALDLRRAEELQAGDAIAASQNYDATRFSSETARAGAGANRAQYAAALANAELAHAAREERRGRARRSRELQLWYTRSARPPTA